MIDFLLLCDSGLGEPRQPKIAEVRNYMLKRSSSALKTWVVVGVGALVLALSAFFILATFSPDPTLAQTPGPIQYAENSDVDDMPVRTFTSEDPEGAGINWDVTGIDADDFTISGGVLRFKKSPNYEKPTNRSGADNMYQITIRASEMRASGYMGLALSTETHVTVEVTNVNEDGIVTIDLRQPEVGTPIMAAVTDPDGTNGVTWQWSVSTVTNPVPTADNHWANVTGNNPIGATYTPSASVDEDKYLRAVASYTDSLGVARTATGVSEFPVRAEVTTDNDGDSNPENGSPGFEQGADYTRTVSESLDIGMNVGAPVVATDPNDDELTYELDDDIPANRFATDGTGTAIASGDDAEYFSIDKETGQIKVKKPLDWDMNGTPPDGKYMFYVRAIDPSGETAHVEVTVIANDANDAPTIMGSTATTGDAPAAPSEIRVLEQDSDDRYDDVALDATTGLITSGTGMPDGDADATYYGTPDGMWHRDMLGSAMGLPVALALGNQNVFTAPDEDERGQITWTLDGVDQDDFVLSQTNLSGSDEPVAIVFKDAPDYENPTDADGDSVYKVTLVATDSGGLMDTRPLTIFVGNVEEQGKATLMATGNGIDQPTIGSEITANVEDPDGGVAVLTWQWQRSRTEDGAFEIIDYATAPDYTPTGADDGYYLRAIATYIDATSEMDNPDTGAIDERVQESAAAAYTPTMGDGVDPNPGDRVFRVDVTSKYAVRVGPGGIPGPTDMAFAMESYELMLVENAEVGSIVGMPVRATGAAPIIYDLNATDTDDNYFMIDRYGQIRVKGIDFRPGRVGIIYPMVDDSLSIDDPGYPYGNYAPAMEDPVLDFEGNNVFRLVVTATDGNDANRKARADVTIRLTDRNERPYFDKASRDAVAAAKEYRETQVDRVVPLAATEPDGGILRWEVAGVDAADFEIMDVVDIPGDGKDRVDLHFKSQPDYEKPTDRAHAAMGVAGKDNMYQITVRAVEMTAVGDGPNLAAELPVTVQVTNSDEPGEVEVKWLQPEVGTPLPAALTDMDGNPGATLPIVMANGDTMITAANIGWQWYRAKNSDPDLDPSAATLASDWEVISGAAMATYEPQGADADLKLLVKADYTDGQGAGKSAIGTTYMPVRPDVLDADNNSPDFTHNTTTRSVPEDTAVGANVGAAVKVDINEDNDRLTYELDNDNDRTNVLDRGTPENPTDITFFSIDKKTGQIMVAKPLDWDNNPSASDDPDGKYEVWVRATDPSGEMTNNEDTDDIKVTITATDVNEAPAVTGGLAEISIYEDSDKFVGLGYMQDGMMNSDNLYRRLDHDRVDSGRWSIGGDDGHLFEYSTPVGEQDIGRRLHFKKANLPDYENPMDDNRDNVYEVTVIVQDNAGLTGMKDVRITVMNVNEAGKLVLSPEQPHAGVPVIATLEDPDGVEIITDWKWAETSSRVPAFPDSSIDPRSTTDEHTGRVGNFVWAMVDYRDGASVDDDPVTALDERNNDPETDAVIEYHKFPVDDNDDLDHNSDWMMSKGTDNAVRTDPSGGTGPTMPSLDMIPVDLMVDENVPSTGYVGIPLNYYDLRYPDGKGGYEFRDTIGGPDVASFVFAEDKDNSVGDGYYDSMLVNESTSDKYGQLAAAVATHFDYEGDKTEYIIEVTDPDAEVSVGPVRVTITVMNVNEAPSAPSELKGGITVSGPSAVDYNEITDPMVAADWNTLAREHSVAMFRAQGGESASAVWTLNGADAGAFTITANGDNGMDDTTGADAVLTFDAAPNYEMPADADMNNMYQITLTASDGTNRASRDITVTVMNMDDMGEVMLDPMMAPQVDEPITATLEDADGSITGLTWKWQKDDAQGNYSDVATQPVDDPATTNVDESAIYVPVMADEGSHIQAVAMYNDGHAEDKMAMGHTDDPVGAIPSTGSDLGDHYDSTANGGNENGLVDTMELLRAVRDYFAAGSNITVAEMLELVRIYFAS